MNTYYKYFTILVVIIQEVCGKSNNTKTLVRVRRLLPPPPPLFPSILYGYNAATGILCALAIPVPLPDQNVFVSYNFEANYNMANQPYDAVPGPLIRLKLNEPYPAVNPNGDAYYSDVIARDMKHDEEEDDFVDEEVETTTIQTDDENNHDIEKRGIMSSMRTIFTRVGIYTMLISRLDAHGIDGSKCLLHAICESARISFLDGNGVLGHIFHVILTPSASAKEENLPSEFYKAEHLGLSGNCRKYEKACNLNILNLFSKII